MGPGSRPGRRKRRRSARRLHCNSIRASAHYNGLIDQATFNTPMAHHHHDHNHGRSHGHDHAGHSHAPDSFGAAFAAGALLNAAFVVAELIFGYTANSLALISDAVHNLSDVIALLLAWGGVWLAGRRPTETRTYRHRRAPLRAPAFHPRPLTRPA